MKNAKTINLLTSYPNRRIQIVLKLLSSPTDILLNFDLDACAIGFDGSHVLMLPRCARAIETGYSVFTMELVWGHHLGNRRASQENRILKYADRGFGIRFLPSYIRSLEEDRLEQEAFNKGLVPTKITTTSDSDDLVRLNSKPRNRKPDGNEPGLKTIKRIAYLGQDYVQRFCFGVSPLILSPKQCLQSLLADPNPSASSNMFSSDMQDPAEAEWWEEYRLSEIEFESLSKANDERRAQGKACEGPLITLGDFDTGDLHTGLPDGRTGLGNLEIFMRHCEAWRMHAHADIM